MSLPFPSQPSTSDCRISLLDSRYCLWLALFITLTPIIGLLFLPDVAELIGSGHLSDYLATVGIVGLAVLGCLNLNDNSDQLVLSLLKSTIFAFGTSYLFLGFSTHFFFYSVIAACPAMLYTKKLFKGAAFVLYAIFLITVQLLLVGDSYTFGSRRTDIGKDRRALALINNHIYRFIHDYDTPPNTLIELKDKLQLADSDIMTPEFDASGFNSKRGGPLVYIWNIRHGAKNIKQPRAYIYSKEQFERGLPYLCTPPGVLPCSYINVAINGDVYTIFEDDCRFGKNIRSLLLSSGKE